MKRLTIGYAAGIITLIVVARIYVVGNKQSTPQQSQQSIVASGQKDGIDMTYEKPQTTSSTNSTTTTTNSQVSSSSSVNTQSQSTDGQVSASVAIGFDSATYSNTSVTVHKGAVIIWTNNDTSTHTVTTADGSTEVFDSGQIEPSKTYTRAFDRVGTYTYHCVDHPNMKGSVTVTN